ncbi:unnamed protein product [Chondrus crispus]|uniref:Uncharacterized protein n=1 Tax=Chondrus crispus TaxID=2769 RepID=R7Q5E6_CHOCR|nr:unnamed protein product [Chondrus crispus]CDF32685.1 unnamed protein product [Chondrus crispus]|eukprot:XP_005712456.1 unnamed protein product [Chondrus crispus]
MSTAPPPPPRTPTLRTQINTKDRILKHTLFVVRAPQLCNRTIQTESTAFLSTHETQPSDKIHLHCHKPSAHFNIPHPTVPQPTMHTHAHTHTPPCPA